MLDPLSHLGALFNRQIAGGIAEQVTERVKHEMLEIFYARNMA